MEVMKHSPCNQQNRLEERQGPAQAPMRKIVTVASIAAGVQRLWALQLSLLTPYVQLLGVPHTWASFIWLCGPISGMIVQPLVGYYSDRCTSRFGRRRPFIAAGTALAAVAVFLICFAADIGVASGDHADRTPKHRAIAVFVVGFWILDVASNMLHGSCRAFLADLSGDNNRKMLTANAFFSFFMAVGNVFGYVAGRYTHLYKIFPFTATKACDIFCANMKSCFLISIFLLVVLNTIALITVTETVFSSPESENNGGLNGIDKEGEKAKLVPFFREIFGALKDLPRPMWILLLVTALNWTAWFPFQVYGTDWMGSEVYGGKAGEGTAYGYGVRAGALGLMLTAVVLGAVSLGVEHLSRWLGGVKRLWGGVNFLLAVCLAMTVVITKLAESTRSAVMAGNGGVVPEQPVPGVKMGALTLFAMLGIPQAITFSVPFAMASIFCNNSGSGQGFSLGVLNLAIVIPQMVVSVVCGPWDALFGGGNLPAFVVGAIVAAVSAVLALTLLPSPPPNTSPSLTIPASRFHGG